MEELIRKRGRVKAKLTRICNFIDNCDLNTSITDIKLRHDTLTEVWSDFDNTQMQIECECKDDELAAHQQEQEEFETRFFEVKARLIKACEIRSNEPNSNSPRPLQIKLPDIQLPTFSGDYKQWSAFADLFKSVIHNNSSLTSVQKLHYLKSAIKGDAAGLLSSMAITDVNYLEAWKILNDRYSNRRQVIQSHLKALYAQPKLATEVVRDIRKLLDVTVENVRALHALDLPTDEWDCLITFMVTERLDSNTRRHWELATGDQENPSFDDLKDFLEKRCRALESSGYELKGYASPKDKAGHKFKKVPATTSYHVSTGSCVKCGNHHPLFGCKEFLRLSIEDRIELVKSSSLCFNCMKPEHRAKDCKASNCRKCRRPHNTLLHREVEKKEENATNTDVKAHHSQAQSYNTQVLLATALVNLQDSSGRLQKIRALLDSGSQATFITNDCAQRLGLKKLKTNVAVGGLGATGVGTCKGIVRLHVSSIQTSFNYELQALVLSKVTGIIPYQPIETSGLNAIIQQHHLDLADPSYHQPGDVELLLGADIYYELLLSGKFRESNNGTIIQNTNLGWIISGTVPAKTSLVVVTSHLAFKDLEYHLRRFWEMEEITQERPLTQEEVYCEEHFKMNTSRLDNGRFVVRLPFHKEHACLGDTSYIAKQRLLHMERKLMHNYELKQEYNAFMKEYVELKHMELVRSEVTTNTGYYLPHHYVIKETSSTTKLRVVFDGTVSPTNGISLNHALMVGPTIQDELLNILMRFRLYKVVFTADINKMYRQILVHPDDCKYQRIFWRESSSEPIQEYQLKTVTYGTAAAPFLATRCLVELSNHGENTHPLASTVIKRDFYVDDVMSGANSLEEALQIQSQLLDLLASAGMELRKWASNKRKLVEHLPTTLLNSDHSKGLAYDSIKTLGIQWQPEADYFKFKVTIEPAGIITKRVILSQISKLFDPLGWLAPVVVYAKMMIQRLWLLGLAWDEEVPVTVAVDWKLFHCDLKLLETVQIPRQMVYGSESGMYQLHGFCDASEAAFGAVIYIRSSRPPVLHLVCSKSRVAPLKKVSLPRLELCGALILARLMNKVGNNLMIRPEQCFGWTDSTIVLAWITKSPHHWKTFVANRVAELQDLLPPERWKHVMSDSNPADCLSRGLSPELLINHKLWWSGPGWLTLEETCWPSKRRTFDNDKNQESLEQRKPVLEACIAVLRASQFIENFSSLRRLVNVTSYCRRFLHNCQPKNERMTGCITVKETESSLHLWIRLIQLEVFSRDIQDCSENKTVAPNSILRSLCPFVDGKGMLRVGGRLHQSDLPYEQKHPLILPPHHALTTLIVRHTHLLNLHAGPQLLQSILNKRYWIIRSRQLVRQVVHRCVTCFRHRVTSSQQLMGSLPRPRVEPARAFLHCGVDYAGPLMLKSANGRGRGRAHKAYVCVFVCFTTRAIHIELANDMTTASFIAAFRRFIARRGKPSDIHSDCGSNFIGAQRQLHEMSKLISSTTYNEKLTDTLNQEGINWHFNPPSAPHFGGLWEAGIKSIKFHLRRIVGNTSLTYEEMHTVLTQIEACLNSRPLCPMSSDPADLTVLTPGHFLIGEALVTAPDQDTTELKINRLSRWHLVQRLYQHFWRRWSHEYLVRLQQRPKWVTRKANIEVGDLILLKETDKSPLVWPMARVVQLHPGVDGLIRVVTVRTATGLMKRPVVKCCVLPIEDSPRSDVE